MITVRWCSFLTALTTLVLLTVTELGWGTLLLALIGGAAFLTLCWTFDAFKRDTWVQDIPEDHPDGFRIDEREGHR